MSAAGGQAIHVTANAPPTPAETTNLSSLIRAKLRGQTTGFSDAHLSLSPRDYSPRRTSRRTLPQAKQAQPSLVITPAGDVVNNDDDLFLDAKDILEQAVRDLNTLYKEHKTGAYLKKSWRSTIAAFSVWQGMLGSLNFPQWARQHFGVDLILESLTAEFGRKALDAVYGKDKRSRIVQLAAICGLEDARLFALWFGCDDPRTPSRDTVRVIFGHLKHATAEEVRRFLDTIYPEAIQKWAARQGIDTRTCKGRLRCVFARRMFEDIETTKKAHLIVRDLGLENRDDASDEWVYAGNEDRQDGEDPRADTITAKSSSIHRETPPSPPTTIASWPAKKTAPRPPSQEPSTPVFPPAQLPFPPPPTPMNPPSFHPPLRHTATSPKPESTIHLELLLTDAHATGYRLYQHVQQTPPPISKPLHYFDFTPSPPDNKPEDNTARWLVQFKNETPISPEEEEDVWCSDLTSNDLADVTGVTSPDLSVEGYQRPAIVSSWRRKRKFTEEEETLDMVRASPSAKKQWVWRASVEDAPEEVVATQQPLGDALMEPALPQAVAQHGPVAQAPLQQVEMLEASAREASEKCPVQIPVRKITEVKPPAPHFAPRLGAPVKKVAETRPPTQLVPVPEIPIKKAASVNHPVSHIPVREIPAEQDKVAEKALVQH